MTISKLTALQPPPDSPATQAEAVDLSSTDYVASISSTRALYVGGTGDVKVDMVGGQTGIIFSSVPAGFILPICVLKIYKTLTTATLIVALY